jgi:hypothetical protein
MEIKGIETVKQAKELNELASPGAVGGGGIESSRRKVSYEYSICQDK